jgi:hypothetical protein
MGQNMVKFVLKIGIVTLATGEIIRICKLLSGLNKVIYTFHMIHEIL